MSTATTPNDADKRIKQRKLLTDTGYTIVSQGPASWFALLPGETQFFDNGGDPHKQNYKGFFCNEYDLLDEIAGELENDAEEAAHPEVRVIVANGLRTPRLPFALDSSIIIIDESTTVVQAKAWMAEMDAKYDGYFSTTFPEWTWNEMHDLDRDVMVELEEIIRASVKPPLDLDLVSSFRTAEWRAPYERQRQEMLNRIN